MTKKRLKENLAFLLEIEQELISQGKKLSKTFYAMKEDVLNQLEAA